MKPPSPIIGLQNFSRLWDEIAADAGAALERVGRSDQWILGREVERFENELAHYLGLAHAIGCGNGMDAIEIALRVGGIQPGDKVLTTPLSAFATTLAILRANAIPVFVDVDESGLIDLSLAEEALAADTAIRGFVPVHLYGHALDVRRLARLRERFRLCLVEDCAQAIGAAYGGGKIGTAGGFAAISFYPTKNLGAMGDGGAVLTNDAQAALQAKKLRNYGQSEKFVHDIAGMNSRLDEVQAALLSALLARLEGHTQKRRAAAAFYHAHLTSEHVRYLPAPAESDSVWHLLPVLVENGRDAFQHYLRENGVDTAVHYPHPIPRQKALEHTGAQVLTSLEQTERLCAQLVSLPLHPFLSAEEMEKIVTLCNAWRK